MTAKRLATLGAMTALAVALGAIEARLPLPLPLPGAKVGVANVVTVFALYALGPGAAAFITAVRIVIVSAMFGSGMSMLYSLCGAALAIASMICAQRIGASPIGAGVIGGVMHNIGQLAVCALIMRTSGVMLIWLPQLIVVGIIAGCAVGVIANEIIRRVKINR